MRDAAAEIEQLTRGHTLEELRTNRMFELSVLHLFVLLGETARRVSNEGRTRYSEIPWRQINGMRNWVVHLYDRVDLALVWSAATQDIPGLVGLLERILR
jgi:uncharacterized protein with HEPN domain